MLRHVCASGLLCLLVPALAWAQPPGPPKAERVEDPGDQPAEAGQRPPVRPPSDAPVAQGQPRAAEARGAREDQDETAAPQPPAGARPPADSRPPGPPPLRRGPRSGLAPPSDSFQPPRRAPDDFPRGGRRPFGGPDALRETDPEMYELEMEDADLNRRSYELAEQYKRATGETRDDLRRQLAKLVAEHFDVRQQKRRLQLSRLEEELKKLRESIEKREDASAQLVKERLRDLTGESTDLGF